MFFCTLVLLAVVATVDSVVSNGINHAVDGNKAFHAALRKYHGEDSLRRLLKRESATEYHERRLKFRKALEEIDDINAQPLPFSARVNYISVMTEEEEASLHNLPEDIITITKRKAGHQNSSPTNTKFRTVDWRIRNPDHKVYDQGACGACWSFGATRSLESAYFANTGINMKISEQYLVDCTNDAYGCNGGWPHNAYDLFNKTGVVPSAESYPYEAEEGQCRQANLENSLTKMNVVGYHQLEKTAKALEENLIHTAVVVGIRASDSFNYYEAGIYECTESRFFCTMRINHAVTAVGYSAREWRVQNSWGPHWGMGGYIMLSRHQENILNLHEYMVVPILECKQGEKCEALVFGDDYDPAEDEKPYDVGDIVKCGLIKHSSEKCVDVVDTEETYLELSDICDRYFCFTKRGFIQDKGNYMCVSINSDKSQLYEEKCRAASTRWSKTSLGFKANGMIFAVESDAANPTEGAMVLAKKGSYDARTSFVMESEKCWEEEDAMRFSKKILEDGKPKTMANLDDAKEYCMQIKCKGVMYDKRKNVYHLGTNRTKKSKSGNKVWVVKECHLCCGAGEERCADGECRSECSDEDKGCPEGTTKCSDGACRHLHLCH